MIVEDGTGIFFFSWLVCRGDILCLGRVEVGREGIKVERVMACAGGGEVIRDLDWIFGGLGGEAVRLDGDCFLFGAEVARRGS